jgi:hypothetical protein
MILFLNLSCELNRKYKVKQFILFGSIPCLCVYKSPLAPKLSRPSGLPNLTFSCIIQLGKKGLNMITSCVKPWTCPEFTPAIHQGRPSSSSSQLGICCLFASSCCCCSVSAWNLLFVCFRLLLLLCFSYVFYVLINDCPSL